MGWRVNDYDLRSLVSTREQAVSYLYVQEVLHRQLSIVNCQSNPLFSSVKHSNPSDRGFKDNTRIDRTSEQRRVDGEVE